MPNGGLADAWRDAKRLFDEGSAAGLDDDALLNRVAARRDEAAFTALVIRHGPLVLAACRRALGSGQEAEDAFQATFLVLARRAANVRGGSLGPWLYGVALRVARRAKAQDQRRHCLDPNALRLVVDPSEGAATAVERAETAAVIDEEIARLAARDRAPLILCDLGGLTHEQAAERLGWPVGTVKSRQARARAKLKARLARRGLATVPVAALCPSATGAIPPRLLQTTVGIAWGFGLQGPASTATVLPAWACLAVESLSKGTIMSKVKLGVVLAALGVSAAVGTVAVRGQSAKGPEAGGSETVRTGARPVAETRTAPGDSTAEGDRLRALEDKLDRLLRAMERTATSTDSTQNPVQKTSPPIAPQPVAPNPAMRDTTVYVVRPPGAALPEPPAASLAERLQQQERRLAALELKLEQLARALQSGTGRASSGPPSESERAKAATPSAPPRPEGPRPPQMQPSVASPRANGPPSGPLTVPETAPVPETPR